MRSGGGLGGVATTAGFVAKRAQPAFRGDIGAGQDDDFRIRPFAVSPVRCVPDAGNGP